MSYQTKDGYYPPQEAAGYSSAGPAGAGADKEYEILEAGLVQNVNSSGAPGAIGWGSNADIEKQLRLGECYYCSLV